MRPTNIITAITRLDSSNRSISKALFFIFLGGGLYGASLGLWRSPLQACYVAVKFPLLLVLTSFCTGLINGMLAQLLGVDKSFGHCFLLVLKSYVLLITILVSFVPLSLFLLYNLPARYSDLSVSGYAIFLLSHVVLIGFAGIVANIQLFVSLSQISGSRSRALRILLSWLGINMFLGCQLSWNLRPFFGSPGLPVHFLRQHPFESNFYEAVFGMLMSMLS